MVEKSRLKTLFNSLVTIILTYTNQLEVSPFVIVSTTTEDYSYNRSPSFDNETLDRLETYISDTLTLSGKTNRTPLMLYILYGVNLLKPLIKNSCILNETETEILNRQLVQLIMDLQRLTTLSPSEHISVTYMNTSVILMGCGSWNSASGQLIKTNLFPPASPLSLRASKDTIDLYIMDALNEQQNPLLLQRIEQLERASESRQKEHLITRGRLLKAQEEIEILRLSPTKQQCTSANVISCVTDNNDEEAESSCAKQPRQLFGYSLWSRFNSGPNEYGRVEKDDHISTSGLFEV